MSDHDAANYDESRYTDRIRVLEAALRKYGQHTQKCDDHPRGRCICGYSAALAPEAAERGYTSTATTMPKQCTPADAAAMQAVIKALEDEKAARKAPRPTASEGET